MKRKNNTRKRGKKDKGQAREQAFKRRYGLTGTIWIDRPGQVVADSAVAFLDSIFQWRMNNAGVSYVNNRIIATGLGSAADIAGEGFTSYYAGQIPFRTMYTRYRVVSFTARVEMINQETFATVLSAGPSNDVISKNFITFYTSRLNAKFHSKMCTQITTTTSARYEKTFNVNCVDFLGSKAELYDDSFVGATSPTGSPGVPANNVYLNVGAFPELGTTNFVNGITCCVFLRQEVVFFEKSVQGN